MTQGLEARVAARLDARLERDVDYPVAIALSGGGDSMALLEVASRWARASGRRLLAITVDHGLRAESGDWSRFCRAAAETAGADWIECRWDGAKPTTGLPAAARRARHALIAGAARVAGARVILFAHTADDIAEADWMRARGSTLGHLREWSPSPAWPEGRGLMLLRPMLEERREALRDWLRGWASHWIEDPGNQAFGRGRARRALTAIALEPAGSPGSMSTGLHDQTVIMPVRPLPLGTGFDVDRDIPTSALAAALVCASGTDTPPRGDRLETLSMRLRAGDAFTATLAGARIEAVGSSVRVGREPGEYRRRPASDIPLTPFVAAVWDGRYEITASEPGWSVSAASGRRPALSKADRAICDALPAGARDSLPVLIRHDDSAPVLAWRKATVRSLAPRRLILALGALSGETTQECALSDAIHGETPPPDLF